MKKRLIGWLDPILLVGLAVSIAISIGMVLSGNDTLSGLMVGLLSAIITLLIDLIARLQKAESTFVEAAQISHLFTHAWSGKAVKEIASLYESIFAHQFDHYNRITEVVTDEFKVKLGELASGSVLVPSKSALQYSSELGISRARNMIKVIHMGPMDYWEMDRGKKTIEMNQAAVRRGVKFTRIFALDDFEAKESFEILQRQENAGINVIIVEPKRVTTPFQLFDDRVVVEYDIHQDGNRYERIIVSPELVRRRINEFAYLEQYSKTLKELN